MKKIKLLIIFLIPILLLTGCDNSDNSKLKKVIKNTSITDRGLKSYRCKVTISNNDDNISYVVLNSENKNYDISVSTKDNNYSYSIKDDKIMGKAIDTNMNYDYTNTDKFLDGLNNATDIKSSKEKIDNNEYDKYTFKINKSSINDILSTFNIKVKKDGNGYAYVDKDNHAYIINYKSGNININISYTRYEDVK